MQRILAIIAATWLVAGAASANDDSVELRNLAAGAASPPASIEDMAWLVGNWVGEGLGGHSEEIVAPPLGGQMMAMFRQTKPDGSLLFYEFYQFAEHRGSVILRIKHFNPDFTGWEDKDSWVEFPLVAIEENAAYFDGLTFVRHGDVLQSTVMVENTGRIDFRYARY